MNSLIFALENVIVVWLTMSLVMGGGFSLGMAFAFIAYKAVFTMSSSSLIDRIAEFRMLGLHLHRLSDIVLTDEDRSFQVLEQPYRSLKGIALGATGGFPSGDAPISQLRQPRQASPAP